MQKSKDNYLSDRYKLFGSVGSPYALKLRAMMRYRRLPFDWIPASLDWVPEGLRRPPLSQAGRKAIADIRPPVIPVVYFPNERKFRNDSTLVAYALEKETPARSIVPPDAGTAFLSHLLEDMADEWGVKIAFLYRWGNQADQVFKSRIVVGELLGGGFSEKVQTACAKQFAERQIGRMPLVGCTRENADLIEETFRRVLAATGQILEHSTFLFGDRPTLADFGWYGQLASLATDPTPRSLMHDLAPGTFSYLQLLEDASGIEHPWASLEEPFSPSVTALIRLAAEVYLPFLQANAKAFEAGKDSFSISALGLNYSQSTFKYQVKCLRWLQEEFAMLQGGKSEQVRSLLKEAGGLEPLIS